MRVRTFFVLFAALFVILTTGGVAWSQTVQGVITGVVTDPSNAVVPNVTVTITNVGTNISQTTATGPDGVYRFPLVPPGTYAIDMKAANFAETRGTGIVVQASQTVPFNVRLELAKASQIVEVTGQAPLVQTATSDLATQVDRTTILNAPLADRDVFSTLPFIAPQVMPGLDTLPTAGGARESGTSYMLNGGDDNDNFSEGGVNIHPALESVQDFSIKTNSMSAEYGRGAGALVSVDQVTGTNKFHGSLYEFNRNAFLNANDWFYDRLFHNDTSGLLGKRPKYIRNQFGGEVDGPIIKDKTFFSFAYDRVKLLASGNAANNFVPTSAAIAFVKAKGGTLANQILSAFPPVTSDASCPLSVAPAGTTGAGTQANGVPKTVGCLAFSDPETDTQNTYFGRVDHNFSSSDRLSFTANIFREDFVDKFGGQPLNTTGATAGTTTNHFHNFALNETHTFSPSLVNEVTVAHNRFFNVFIEGDGKTTIPNIFVDNQNEGNLNYQIGGPFEGGQVQSFVQDRWGAHDSLTWTFGRHSLKFGGGGQYGILYRNWDLGLPGQYEFGELITVQPGTCTPSPCPVVTPKTDPTVAGGTLQPDGTIANVTDQTQSNFAGDYPYFQETSIDPRTGLKASAYRHYTYHDYDWFVQDDWKLMPRFTLNLGLRWNRYGAPSEDHNILAQFGSTCANILDPVCIGNMRVVPAKRMWPTQNHDFGPRFGFAWDVFGDGKTAVRGGYGIYYDRIFDNVWSNGAWNPPFYALIDFEADTGDAIFYSNPASIGAAYNPNGPNGPIPFPGKRVSVRTMDQNMKDASGQNFYLGVERQFLGNMLLRVNYQGSLGRHLPMLENYNREDGIAANSTLTPIRPNPLYTGFNYRSDSVSSNYNALIAEVQKRMSSGLEFQTSYTFSKLLDVNSDLFSGCSTIGGQTAPYYYISNARPHLSYGPAAYDHRQAYKFSVSYELPFFKGQKGFVGHALGGWNLGSFLQLYTGHPIDVHDGRTRFRARDVNGNVVKDANGIPINIGGDYNLDGVGNDHPIFIGNMNSVYRNGSPADGIFSDNNVIGCGAPWVPASVANVDACNKRFGVNLATATSPGTPNSLFVTPPYPGSGPTFERFGTLGRDVFHGPKFVQMDLALSKTFKLTETTKLAFRAQAQNLANHPNFDCVDSTLGSGTFGQAQCITPFGLGAPKSRVMSIGARFSF